MKPTVTLALPLLLAVLALGPGVPAHGEDDAPAPAAPVREAVVPVKVVAGKLVVSCDISTRARRIPVNLFIELDQKAGLRLHNRAAMGIRAENRDGTPNAITIAASTPIRTPRPPLAVAASTRRTMPGRRYSGVST